MEKRLWKRPKEKPRLLLKPSKQPPAELNVEIGLPSIRLAETVRACVLPETRQPAAYRSRTVIRRKGRVIELNINADDIVALRAASNSFLRFVSVALKTQNVVAPFYRAASRD